MERACPNSTTLFIRDRAIYPEFAPVLRNQWNVLETG
jgi:hypothetical protein